MKARVKRYHSPDIDDLQGHVPEDLECFCFLLQIMIAPDGVDGEESFDILVCTPKYLDGTNDHTMADFGRHMLLAKHYDFRRIADKIESFCDSLDEPDWEALACKSARIGHWEFEDYEES